MGLARARHDCVSLSQYFRATVRRRKGPTQSCTGAAGAGAAVGGLSAVAIGAAAVAAIAVVAVVAAGSSATTTLPPP